MRLRRDFGAILGLIRAHAILHQESREKDTRGRVVDDITHDYEVVKSLVTDIMSEGLDSSVSITVRETVAAVAELISANSQDCSVTQVSKFLGLDKSATSRRVADARRKEYLKNLEDKKGKPARLVLGDPMPKDTFLLPEANVLVDERCSVAVEPEEINLPSVMQQHESHTRKSILTDVAGGFGRPEEEQLSAAHAIQIQRDYDLMSWVNFSVKYRSP